jgi:hypothetical protein
MYRLSSLIGAIALSCSLVMFFGTTQSAQATLLVYEGFDYTPGALGGQGGVEDGWGGSWSVRASDGISVQVLEDGLTFGPLLQSGGSLRLQTNLANGNDRYNRAGRPLGPEIDYSGTVWHSHLLFIEPVKRTLSEGNLVTEPITGLDSRWEARVDIDSTGDTGRTGNPDRFGFAGTRDGGDVGRQVLTSTSTNASGTGLTVNTTYLIIGKVEGIGGTNPNGLDYDYTATMWVLTLENYQALVNSGWDESILDTERIQFATQSLTSDELATFSSSDFVQIHTRDWSTSGFSPIYDEIRYGTTLYSVTPIPEPATAGLLALGALGLLARRRRRQA